MGILMSRYELHNLEMAWVEHVHVGVCVHSVCPVQVYPGKQTELFILYAFILCILCLTHAFPLCVCSVSVLCPSCESVLFFLWFVSVLCRSVFSVSILCIPASILYVLCRSCVFPVSLSCV